jgi:hypothetical protein
LEVARERVKKKQDKDQGALVEFSLFLVVLFSDLTTLLLVEAIANPLL